MQWRAIAMTSPDHEPPPMVPSAKERVDTVYEAWNSPDSAPDIEALHERAMEQAYHDGWNAARAAQAERDQINFDEGRAFERGDAPPQYECPECGDTHLASFHAPPQPSEALAARYNVSTGAISMAARGVTWRWL